MLLSLLTEFLLIDNLLDYKSLESDLNQIMKHFLFLCLAVIFMLSSNFYESCNRTSRGRVLATTTSTTASFKGEGDL